MMLEDLAKRLERVKWRSGSRFIASCLGPLHGRGDKRPSLSCQVRDQKILLHCFSGCSVLDVCDALGIRISDLFLDGPSRPPIRTRRDVALEHLAEWRERALTRVCQTLRALYGVTDEIQNRFRAAGVDSLDEFNEALRMSETDFDIAVAEMEAAYKLTSEFESDFERLNSNDRAAWAAVWRERCQDAK